MEYKNIRDLSFFSKEQKELFKNYIISKDGKVFNKKTNKDISNTIHGTRGYVANLSVRRDGVRIQRQIVIHRAIADLFIRPIKSGEKLCFVDKDKTNISISNLTYKITEQKKKEEYSKCLAEMKGITDYGRICTTCGELKEWKLMSANSSAICRTCASKRGVEYQKKHKYSEQPVPYDTYATRFKDDGPIDIDGFLGFYCYICKEQFKIQRGKVLNRLRSIKLKYNVQPLICTECKEEEK